MRHTCIDAEAKATLHDGSRKLVKDLEIGDRVKTLNENGQLVDTDVIMMMDISNHECKACFDLDEEAATWHLA